jgi:CelD/BcsL family acetyltransferase involved in cellulose biosynthesis
LPVDFRVVRPSELSSDEIAKWRRLAVDAAEPNPNADPRFILPSLGYVSSANDLHLAIVEESDCFRLVMPFTMGTRLGGVPMPHLTTHGAFMHEFASKNHPLIHPGMPTKSISTMFEGLARSQFPDLVDFTIVPGDSVIAESLAQLHASGDIRCVERVRDSRAYAKREDLQAEDGTWYQRDGELLSFPMPHLSASSRRKAGQWARQLERQLGGPLEVSEIQAEPERIDEFLEMQAAGWKGDSSRSGPQFRRRGLEPWFRAVTDAFHADGDLRVLRVSSRGQTIYAAVYVVSGGRMFGFHDVFDERFSRSSPGQVGRLVQLGHVLRSPEAAPFDPGMEAWYTQANGVFPSRRDHVGYLAAGRSWRSRAVVMALPRVRNVRDRLSRREAEQP